MALSALREAIPIHLTRGTALGLVVVFFLFRIIFSYIRAFTSSQLKNIKGPSWTRFTDFDMLKAVIQGRRVHVSLSITFTEGSV